MKSNNTEDSKYCKCQSSDKVFLEQKYITFWGDKKIAYTVNICKTCGGIYEDPDLSKLKDEQV